MKGNDRILNFPNRRVFRTALQMKEGKAEPQQCVMPLEVISSTTRVDSGQE